MLAMQNRKNADSFIEKSTEFWFEEDCKWITEQKEMKGKEATKKKQFEQTHSPSAPTVRMMNHNWCCILQRSLWTLRNAPWMILLMMGFFFSHFFGIFIQFSLLISINIYLSAVDCSFFVCVYVYVCVCMRISWIGVHLHMSSRLIFNNFTTHPMNDQTTNKYIVN